MSVHRSLATVLGFAPRGAGRVRPLPPALLVAIVAVLMVGVLPWGRGSTATAQTSEPAPGGRAERIPVIVALEKGVDPRMAARRFGVAPKHVYRHAINGFAADVPNEALNGLQTSPQVASVTPDYEVRIAAQTLPTGINRIDADTSPMADISGGGDNIAADVAVIDTGVDRNHPDLNIAGGYNCTTQDPDKWDDDNGHGPHVAGTIGAVDNDAGVVGVAPGVRLWGVKVLGANGSGKVSDVICGLNWVIAQKTSKPRTLPSSI